MFNLEEALFLRNKMKMGSKNQEFVDGNSVESDGDDGDDDSRGGSSNTFLVNRCV